ncbi:MAG: immunity 70 family protein [Eubacteriales bacterium]|jgi:2,3-bisphosphoglycerate-dependent phosphoglycerate mutase
MAIGFEVDKYWYPVGPMGAGDYLYSFFSTIAYHLEKGKWGSRFPAVMGPLYQGELQQQYIERAMDELRVVQRELKQFSPKQVIWSFEDLSQQPPWGDDISENVTDLSNYYVTCEGEDLIGVLLAALDHAKELKQNLYIG